MAGTALAEDTDYPNTVSQSFKATVPYPSLIRPGSHWEIRNLIVSRALRRELGRQIVPLSLLLVASKESFSLLLLSVALVVVILWYTNATRPHCCTRSERCRPKRENICFTLRSWTIRNIHGILQDAEAFSLGSKIHNLHWKLNRRHW